MKNEIADDLRELAADMNRVANKMMDFSDDVSCKEKINFQNRAREMLGAASMAQEWAMSISDDV